MVSASNHAAFAFPVRSDEVGAPPLVTFVMYHYVRARARTRFPRLPALDLDAFREQLVYIGRHYSPVSAQDVVAAASGAATLPPRPIVLTFDDGYAEHYRDVCPLLGDRGIPATFFPVASSLIDRRVLDVNKIQFLLAAAESPAALVEAIERAVERESSRRDVRTTAEYRDEGWKPVRYDPADASYVKYMLQRALPQDIRASVIDELFITVVSADERAFAEELYFTADQGREMANAGMTIGCHADTHATLTSLTRDGQAREIDGAMRVLDAIGLPRRPFVYSYAKGEHNADSVDLLRARGCVLAVTTRVDLATIAPETMLTLPRIDAIHVPADGSAAPNEWTRRAGGIGN